MEATWWRALSPPLKGTRRVSPKAPTAGSSSSSPAYWDANARPAGAQLLAGTEAFAPGAAPPSQRQPGLPRGRPFQDKRNRGPTRSRGRWEAGERYCLVLPALCHRVPDFQPQSEVSLQVDEGSFVNLLWSSGLGGEGGRAVWGLLSLSQQVYKLGEQSPSTMGNHQRENVSVRTQERCLGPPPGVKWAHTVWEKTNTQLQTLTINAA